MSRNTVVACAECGGMRVEVTAWIDANGRGEISGDPPSDDAWCPRCQDHVSTLYVERVGDHWEDGFAWMPAHPSERYPTLRAALRDLRHCGQRRRSTA